MSRVTVREAIRVLQGEGLLITKRGNGGTVASPTVADLGGVSSGAAYGRRLGEVFELRLAVETMAARLAAQRGRPEDLQWLDSCQEGLKSSKDVHAFRRADSEFHLAVARMSGNDMLSQVVEDVRAAAFARLDRQDFAVLHESSIRGQPRLSRQFSAAAAMTAHIEEAREEVRAALAKRDTPEVRSAG